MLNLSVIIPTHNRPHLVARAIKSVISQTLKPYEVIVVDDSDSKETKSLVEGHFDSSVRYILNQSNEGASSSRNLGAEISTGDFIAFLDDDDKWLPEKLSKQLDLIRKNGLDCCFSRLLIKYENCNLEYSTRASLPTEVTQSILLENFIGGTISSVIRRDLFLELGGFDTVFKAREEYDLWIRLIHSGAKIGIVEEPLAVAYRSLSQRARISANIDNYVSAIHRLNEKHDALVKKTLTQEQAVIRKSRQYEFLAAQAVSIGLRKVAFKWYFMSFLNKPSFKSLVGSIIALISPIGLIKIRARF